jgi:exonuclease III
LVELSVAGINVRSFYVPRNESNKTAHFAFNLRLNVNDQYLMKKNKDGVSILNK